MCRNCNITCWRHRQPQCQVWPEDARRGDNSWWFFWGFFWRKSATDDSKKIIRSEQAVVKLSMEAKGTIRRLKSPRTTQLLKIERRDGIVVTGTIPLEQIYNFISDDIRTHTHTNLWIMCKFYFSEGDFFLFQDSKQKQQRENKYICISSTAV